MSKAELQFLINVDPGDNAFMVTTTKEVWIDIDVQGWGDGDWGVNTPLVTDWFAEGDSEDFAEEVAGGCASD